MKMIGVDDSGDGNDHEHGDDDDEDTMMMTMTMTTMMMMVMMVMVVVMMMMVVMVMMVVVMTMTMTMKKMKKKMMMTMVMILEMITGSRSLDLFGRNPFAGASGTRSKPKRRNRENRSILPTLSSILPMIHMQEASHLWELRSCQLSQMIALQFHAHPHPHPQVGAA